MTKVHRIDLDLTDAQTEHVFLVELDGMIESTEEFIRDDGLGTEPCRIHDLSALIRVRDLYLETYTPNKSS